MTNASPAHLGYQSPLESRYASAEMRQVWSAQRKHSTWRRIWLAVAEAQRELGLNITDQQIQELREHLDDIDFDRAAEYERKLRHDVMAHVHALGDLAPSARPIIHLGMTSQDVNCNTELILLRDALQIIANKLARVVDALGTFAIEYRDLPTLGFTHYQPAQPTTVGKRATLWAYDFALALEDIEHRLETLRFKGVRGATGTQASFLALFDGDARAVEELDQLVAEKMNWPTDMRFSVVGQTYPRVVDAQILNTLAVAAAAVHKCASDLRLLANRKEVEEPFETDQIGSSAMPYKRNPMRCERATGMARFVMGLAQNPLNTAATQWLERTLDDSANRRLALPEAFLALDGVLDIMRNVTGGLVVYERTIRANLMAELPFMASENMLMAAVQQGADRQEAHEVIRLHSQAAAQRVKEEAGSNDLLERLRGEAMFASVDFDEVLDPSAYVGRAPEQVDRFVQDVVEPIRQRFAGALTQASEELRV
ncbi:MAG: adenylosuccinate lyase [Phycisphaerales bacterium]|nr:MAG: adenylosuccinate lyase [Phycisphaerales bacterium]